MSSRKLIEIEEEFVKLIRVSVKTEEQMRQLDLLGGLLDKELNIDETDLLIDIRNVGLIISSVWDLVNSRERYPQVIPILVEHLFKPYHKRNKEGIIRALTVKEARGKAGRALIAEFYKTPKSETNYRWAIGNAMAIVMSSEDEKDVLEIVKDKSNGEARDMFVRGLSRSKSTATEHVLIDLLDDEDDLVVIEAIKSLWKLKSNKAMEKIYSLLHHSSPAIKKEAQKVLNKLK